MLSKRRRGVFTPINGGKGRFQLYLAKLGPGALVPFKPLLAKIILPIYLISYYLLFYLGLSLLSLDLAKAHCALSAQAERDLAPLAQHLPIAKEPLLIETSYACQLFYIEIAKRPLEQEKGLMFRRFLAPSAGMLFIFPHEDFHSMWMRNSFIPLDILFINKFGKIVDIIANSEPCSLALLTPKAKASYILEIKGAMARQKGIKIGDRVVHNSMAILP